MSNRPPPPPRPDNILSYESHFPTRLSRLAVASFIISILATLGFFLVIPPIFAFIFALIAGRRIVRHPTKLAGIGYTNAATTISLCSVFMAILMVLFLPTLAGSDRHHPCTACMANLRGIMNSMIIYAAQNNDHFPIVTYAPYSPALNSPTADATATTNEEDAYNSYYTAPYPQAGSVTANLWGMVLQGMSPKLLICRSDPYVTGPAQLQDSSNRFYNNIQNDKQLSYSFAYPWKSDGTVGKWWANTSDASIPIASDMAPEHGTGLPLRTPTRNLTPLTTPRDPTTWLSANHQGKYGGGQNVAFADVHVEWVTRPTVGQMNDNIFTTSAYTSTAPAEFGGLPAIKASPNLTADSPPFDIIMYPIRNLDTGRF